MIESRDYPFLPVQFSVRNLREDVPALVDTGFDGFLVLPEAYLPRLGPPDLAGNWVLADGSTIEAPEFRGTVKIVGLESLVQAQITCFGLEAIVGRAVLDRFAITLDHGHRIIAAD